MYDRAAIKEQAKDAIRGRLLSVFGVIFIVSIVSVIPSLITSAITQNSTSPGVALLSSFISIAGSIFVTIPLSISLCRYCTAIFRGGSPTLGDAFNGYDNFGHYIGTTLLAGLVIMLYMIPYIIVVIFGTVQLIGAAASAFVSPSLSDFPFSGLQVALYILVLFASMIPGIIKSYSYSQISYLVWEFPHMRASEVMAASQEMMKGYKWKYFVFSLSFIGWGLLSILIIPLIYTMPYTSVAYAGFYDWRLKTAVEEGVLSREQLAIDSVGEAKSPVSFDQKYYSDDDNK